MNTMSESAYVGTAHSLVTGQSHARAAPVTSELSEGNNRRPATTSANHGLADFFSLDTFNIVLHNPTTAHRLLKFSQARLCGENMEFLEKVDRYNALLDEMATVLTDVYVSYTSEDASKQLGIGVPLLKRVNSEIKNHTTSTLPAMETIFSEAQGEVEDLIRSSVYPRFVKYQMTSNAAKALSTDRQKYQGLGDCFCITDPNKADNPIVYASDGFIGVTGYSRPEVVPRNCRFLQGLHTDRAATRRLRQSIDEQQETVELLLNYKKNGEPFWNLLYIAPLYDSQKRLTYFIGGQINCSTTIRSNTDVLRILSMSTEPDDTVEDTQSLQKTPKRRFFGLSKKDTNPSLPRTSRKVEVREAGMENGLLKQIEKLDFRSQMERFYTAYSRYFVIRHDHFAIEHYSQGVLDLLGINDRTDHDYVGHNIFKFLSQFSAALPREFKNKVQQALKVGQPISASIDLITPRSLAQRIDDRFFTHWTPTKDENGRTELVVLTLSSSFYD